MNCQRLTGTGDHMAFQQRIKREVGALEDFTVKHDALGARTLSEHKPMSTGNYWLTKVGTHSLTKNHNAILDAYVQQPKVLTHVRLNNGVQGCKDLKSRMIDSTYVNAADPNSMRDLGQTRNAVYSWGIGQHVPKTQSASYSKFLVPKSKPTNNTFYSFGGKSTMNEFRDNEVVAPALLSNSVHLTTNNRHAVREFNTPQIQRVMDYSKNVSQSIFSPGTLTEDYKSHIPEAVQRQARKLQNSASVRMHNYRGTTNLHIGYDPSEPVPISRVGSKFEKIKTLRNEIAKEAMKRKQVERDLVKVKQNLTAAQKQIPTK